MSVSDVETSFKSFGKVFQEQILQALLSDFSWAQQMMEVMRPEYFEVKYLKFLFEIYVKYYNQYKTFPSLVLLATIARDELQSSNDEIMFTQVRDYLNRIRTNPNANDLPYVKDRSLNFCKSQALKEGLEEAVDLIQQERYEEIVGRIKEAITVGSPNTSGHDYFNEFESRFLEKDRTCVSTGIPQLDARDIMNGGLGRGEMGCIISPTGVGKSHFLVQMGANALRQKKNVLHYTFELKDTKVGIRYDSNLTGISATDVLVEKEFVKRRLEELRPSLGNLYIKEYPTNSATVLTLRSHIEKLAVTKDFRPDVIIVDYADIMRSTRQFDSLRHEQKLVYEELRGLGMELGVPIWTASQSNRESTESDILGIDKISESFGKAMVCDFIVTLSRKPLVKSKGLGNLFIPKNRLGKDGILFPVKVDTARSTIEILDKNIDLEEFQRNADTDMKRLLKDKWNEVANERMNELRQENLDRAGGE